MTDTTPKEETPRCKKCGTKMQWNPGEHADERRGYQCPLPESACQSIAALRSENEALRKRNEELERKLEETKQEVESSRRDQDLLAAEMVYHGNSVSWWWSKATAYKKAVGDMCDLMTKHGFRFDGKTSVLTLMESALALLARLDAAEARVKEIRRAWAEQDLHGFEAALSVHPVQVEEKEDE